MPEITVSDVSKTFGSEQALRDVTFTVYDGEFLTLLGPSGCGKTTTLMSIAGFLHPDTGRIACGERTFFDRAAGVHVATEDRNIGIVFQSYAVWPHMTVAQNVAFPLKVRKAGKKAATQRTDDMLHLVEMAAYADRYPHELSGGQQQRVALARALVYQPSVLLLDEPFSNLDAKLRERARTWVKHLQATLGLTTVFVTHDQDEALSMSDRVLVMNHGVILQAGSPEEVYQKPANSFVAEFLGGCNILTGQVTAQARQGSAAVIAIEPSGALLVLDEPGLKMGHQVQLALRPESISLTDDPDVSIENSMVADVLARSFLGDHYIYELDAGGIPLTATDTRAWASPKLTARIPPDACRLLAT